MQTIVAFRFSKPRKLRSIFCGLERLRSHYSKYSNLHLSLKGWISQTGGLVALVPKVPPSNWPMWVEREELAVATVYAPFGWRKVIDVDNIEEAPFALTDEIIRDPRCIDKIAPPFCLFSYNSVKNKINVINDGLGYARIYEFKSRKGAVVSSRAEAGPIFLGEAPEADDAGWQTLAGCGWFMGSTTPFEGVSHLEPGSLLEWSLPDRSESRAICDSARHWVSDPFDSIDRAAESVASEMRNFAREVSETWSIRPTLHLSGGRDSRAAAAAFVAAGVPAVFHTVGSLKGELDVASNLLAAVERTADHSVVFEKDSSTTGDIVERAVRLQLAYGGIYGPAGVKQSLFKGFGRTYPVVTGAAGEIARGNFYKDAHLAKIRSEGPRGAINRLVRLYEFHGCVHGHVHEVVNKHIEEKIEEAISAGVRDASVLDYFYLTERLRRWSNASAKIGTLTPLAVPAYIRGAFSQAPEQKLQETFHIGVISRLVPQWSDIPFYKAKPEDNTKRTRPWLWASGDMEKAREVIHESKVWHDLFDSKKTKETWRDALLGNGGGRHEIIFQRVIWREGFDTTLKHLAGACRSRPTSALCPERLAEGSSEIYRISDKG